MAGESELIHALVTRDWRKITAVLPPFTPYYFDIVLETTVETLRFTGESNVLPDATELFSLKVEECVGHERGIPPEEWRVPHGNWQIKDLTRKWAGTAAEQFLWAPRKVKFFSHPCFEKVTFPAKSLLKSCVAIELTKENIADKRLIFLASQSTPCNVAVTSEECRDFLEYEAKLLENMKEIEINYFNSS